MPIRSKTRKATPTRHPTILADDTALVLAIDAFVRGDRSYGRQTKEILRKQRELRALLDAKQWEEYVGIEDTTNERVAHALLTVAGWAFAEGQRTRAR